MATEPARSSHPPTGHLERFEQGAARAGRAFGVILAVLLTYAGLVCLVTVSVSDRVAVVAVAGLITFGVVAAVRAVRPSWLNYQPAPATSPPVRFWVACCLCALLALLAGQALGGLASVAIGSDQLADWTRDLQQAPVPLLLATLLIAVPAGEEALMRGMIHPLMRRQFPPGAAALITTVLFALLHGNLIQALAAAPLGLLAAALYERTRKLSHTIVLHAGFNLLAITTPESLTGALADPLLAGLLAAGFAAAFARLWPRSSGR